MGSDALHRYAEEQRREFHRLSALVGRSGLYDHEREHIVREATGRLPRPAAIAFDAAAPASWTDRPRPFVVPGDHVSLRADSMLGLLADLADAKYRAAMLEAMSTERWEVGNARLERTIAGLRDEIGRLHIVIATRQRKAKATEAQRRKAGERRRRNAR